MGRLSQAKRYPLTMDLYPSTTQRVAGRSKMERRGWG